MPTLYVFGNAKMVGTASAVGVAGVKSRRSAVKGEADMQQANREHKQAKHVQTESESGVKQPSPFVVAFLMPLQSGMFAVLQLALA